MKMFIFLIFYFFEETIGKSFLIETAKNKIHGNDFQLHTQRANLEADLLPLTDGLVAVTDELLGNKFSSNGSDYQLPDLITQVSASIHQM